MTHLLTLPDGHTVVLHFNSRFARLTGGINKCVTPNARHIYISRDWVTARGLAHEVGHIQQARRLGWRYLPWVLGCYLTQGYRNSTPEVEADRYMASHLHQFRSYGLVPFWVAR